LAPRRPLSSAVEGFRVIELLMSTASTRYWRTRVRLDCGTASAKCIKRAGPGVPNVADFAGTRSTT